MSYRPRLPTLAWTALAWTASATALLGACSLDTTGRKPATVSVDDPANGDDSASTDDDEVAVRDAGELDAEPTSDARALTRGDAQAEDEPDPRDVLIGLYAERRSFATIQSINTAVFSNDVNVLTTAYSLAEIRREGDDYVLTERACRVATDSGGDFFTQIEVTIDDVVPRSMPAIESVLDATFDSDRLTWERPLRGAPVGWVAGSESESLPASARDPRVRDTDQDGNPGVTAHVNARVGISVDGDIYLVQWNRARYAGELDSEGRLVGENFDQSEQHVIGASTQVLATDPPTRPDPDTSKNRVMLTRLSAPLDCDAMLAKLDQLFPPLETP